MLIGVTHGEQDAGEAVFTSEVGWILRIASTRVVDGFYVGNSRPVSGSTLMANEVEFTQLF